MPTSSAPPPGFTPIQEAPAPAPGPLQSSSQPPPGFQAIASKPLLPQAEKSIEGPINHVAGQMLKTGGSALGALGQVLGTPQRFVAGMQHDKNPGDFEGIYDAFHPNDTERLKKIQEDNENDMSGGNYSKLTGFPKAAADFGYQTVSDPMTAAGGPIVKGLLKGAASLGKLIPGAESAFNAARMPFIGSSHLDKQGIVGADKVAFKGIESSEHGRYSNNVKDFNHNVARHISTRNPAAVPKWAQDPNKIVEIAPGKQAVVREHTVDLGQGNNMRVPQPAGNQHGQRMFHDPAYRDVYNNALKQGMNDKAAQKAAQDTIDSMSTDGLHSSAQKAASGGQPPVKAFKDMTKEERIAERARREDRGYARNAGLPEDMPEKAPRSPQDAANPSEGHIVHTGSQTGAREAAKAAVPQRLPNEPDHLYAQRQVDYYYKNEPSFKSGYDKAAKEGKTQQQAVMEGSRSMFHHYRIDATQGRAQRELGLSKTQTENATQGFMQGKPTGFAKASRGIGNALKSGMFVNPAPHIVGNVGQNAYLSLGLKGAAKAARYATDNGAIPKDVLDKMDQYGASHADFDPFESVDESGGDSPLVEGFKSFGRNAMNLGNKAQNIGGKHSVNAALNSSEQGARAAAFEHFTEQKAKELGVTPDKLTPEHYYDIAQKTRTAIGDYRNKSAVVRWAENNLGSQFPQYRAITVGNVARAAVNHPHRLNNIYRAQDDVNQDVIKDPKHNYTLGGIANTGNKAFSRLSDFVRGVSGLGPVASPLLNIAGVQNANLAGVTPYAAGGGNTSPNNQNSSVMGRIGSNVLSTASQALPVGSNLLYQAALGKGGLSEILKDPQKAGLETLIDALGIQKGAALTPFDKAKINRWENRGGNINDRSLLGPRS